MFAYTSFILCRNQAFLTDYGARYTCATKNGGHGGSGLQAGTETFFSRITWQPCPHPLFSHSQLSRNETEGPRWGRVGWSHPENNSYRPILRRKHKRVRGRTTIFTEYVQRKLTRKFRDASQTTTHRYSSARGWDPGLKSWAAVTTGSGGGWLHVRITYGDVFIGRRNTDSGPTCFRGELVYKLWISIIRAGKLLSIVGFLQIFRRHSLPQDFKMGLRSCTLDSLLWHMLRGKTLREKFVDT